MKHQLMPFTAVQAIGTGFSAWIDGFLKTLPISLGILVLSAGANYLTLGGQGSAGLGAVLGAISGWSLSAFATALFARRVAGLFLPAGRNGTRPLGRATLSALGASALIGILLCLAFLLWGSLLLAPAFLPLIMGLASMGGAFLGLFSSTLTSFLAVVLSVIPLVAAIRRAFGPVCAVLEDLGAFKALERSRALAKGSSWRVFGFLILQNGLVLLLSWSISLLSSLLAAEGLSPLGAVLSGLATALTLPLGASIQVVYLLGLRVRKEGLDVESLASTFDGSAGSVTGSDSPTA